MAQLYKMTLYVRDLEEDLSLNKIKRLNSGSDILRRADNGTVDCLE